MDFGYHNSIRGTVMIYQTAHCNMRNSHTSAVDMLNDVISSMDPQNDKQKFLELNNQAFMLPKKFEFQPYRGDEVECFVGFWENCFIYPFNRQGFLLAHRFHNFLLILLL